MEKHVWWSPDTKAYDGNLKHYAYHKSSSRAPTICPPWHTHKTRDTAAKSDAYESAWMEYCSGDPVERGKMTVL